MKGESERGREWLYEKERREREERVERARNKQKQRLRDNERDKSKDRVRKRLERRGRQSDIEIAVKGVRRRQLFVTLIKTVEYKEK